MLAPQTPQTEWPADGLEYLGLCPVCGSRDRETQYANLRDRLFSAAGTWTLYRCLACEVRYLDPRPNRATIGTAYSAYYTHAESSPSHSAGLLSRFKLSLRNGYLNHVWHTSFTPSLTFVAKCLSAIYPDWASTYERLAVRELPRISGGRLLDIGCGSGNFLVLAKKLGWSVCGIDFDRKALEIARQHDIDVRLGGLEIFADERELFDVITSNHVIEHVHDPKEMLNSCRRLLKKGGDVAD